MSHLLASMDMAAEAYTNGRSVQQMTRGTERDGRILSLNNTAVVSLARYLSQALF